MKNNEALQKDVQDAIKWEPLLHAAEIGVTAEDGIVTLTGSVDNYTKKTEAEDAAKSVAGVKAVVENIQVHLKSIYANKDDNEIAREILNSFKWNWRIPNDKIKVQVESGWVTLGGDLAHSYEKEAAYDSVKNLCGVIGVTDNIKIRSDIDDVVEKEEIMSALRRNWSVGDNDISVTVSDHKATLSGVVDCFFQKDEAEKIAFKAKGIWRVDNELIIDYDYVMNE